MKPPFETPIISGNSPRVLSLSQLGNGEQAYVKKISDSCTGMVRRRLLDLGFVPGTSVKMFGKGLFNGPRRFAVRGNVIALRDEQASMIEAIQS